MLLAGAALVALGLLLAYMRETFERTANHTPIGRLPERRHYDRRGKHDPKYLGPERRRSRGRRIND